MDYHAASQCVLPATVGIVGLFLVMSSALRGEEDYFLWEWLRASQGLPWIPFGQPAIIAAALDPTTSETWFRTGAYLAEASMVTVACWFALRAVHNRGAVTGRGALRGLRGAGAHRQPGTGLVGGIIGKDLKLLARDRTFFVSTLLVPIVVLAGQVAFYPQAFAGISQDPTHLAATAFGCGAYLLLVATTSILNNEGSALWLLYTLPERLERLLARKALMWVPFAYAYSGAVLAYGLLSQGFSAELLVGMVYGMAGLPLYALIGGAIGIFASDPTAQEPRKRVRADSIYLFMLLEGLYVYGFYAPTHWAKATLFILLAALALALWQSVHAQMPFLLDPVSKPAPTISLSDGLIAALFFFVLQALLGMLFLGAFDLPRWPGIVASFSGSGLLIAAVSLGVLWRRRVTGLLLSVGLSLGKGLRAVSREVLIWTLPAALASLGYHYLATQWPWLGDQVASAGSTLFRLDKDSLYWVVGLAVVAAPVFEEIIFRGLVYRGLRPLGRGLAVVASAAVFAAVHPALSLVPVLVMGVCAALAFERSGSLLASMSVHAGYNAATVLFALALAPPAPPDDKTVEATTRTGSVCENATTALTQNDSHIGDFDTLHHSLFHSSRRLSLRFTAGVTSEPWISGSWSLAQTAPPPPHERPVQTRNRSGS